MLTPTLLEPVAEAQECSFAQRVSGGNKRKFTSLPSNTALSIRDQDSTEAVQQRSQDLGPASPEGLPHDAYETEWDSTSRATDCLDYSANTWEELLPLSHLTAAAAVSEQGLDFIAP
jgi:hypothetical protein